MILSQIDNIFFGNISYYIHMSKSLESLCSSTIKYTTSNNIVQQIQQGQLPEDQSEPHSTNINHTRLPQISATSKNHPPPISDEESGQIIFQTVLEKNIRDYDISPEKKKKKIHKQQAKQKKQKQKDKASAEKNNLQREKKIDKKNNPIEEPETINHHNNSQFQPVNSSYFNPYMYNFQVPPMTHAQSHGPFPQPYPVPYMHHNQFGYPNQMPMAPLNHPAQPMTMTIPMNHNPYLIPGPMIQIPQIPAHLSSLPMNPYKQHSLQNHPKQFAIDKNQSIKHQGIKQQYQNSNSYQNIPSHQNSQNHQSNHSYMNYIYNQSNKIPPNPNPNYNSSNYQGSFYTSNNYPNQPNQTNQANQPNQSNPNPYKPNQNYQPQYLPSNNNYNTYQTSNSHNNNYNHQKQSQSFSFTSRQSVQPYQSQRDKKRNRFQQLKQQIREILKQYELQEREQILEILKCLVKYNNFNNFNYQNSNKMLSQGLTLSCFENNLSKIQKMYGDSHKSQMLQKILGLLDLSDIIVKIKQRKLQKLIISQKDLQRTKMLMQKFIKDPRRLQK